jgi:hypothetical protein
MKRTLRLVLFVSAVGVVTVTRGQMPQDSIDIGGVPLKLGMPQGVVLQQLGGPFDLQESAGKSSTSWLVTQKAHPRAAVASVSFKEQKLTFVSKIWTVNEPDTEAALGNALFGAVSSFEQEGKTGCTIKTGQSQGPTVERKTIFIICGQKHLQIDIFRIGQQRETASISEVLQ